MTITVEPACGELRLSRLRYEPLPDVAAVLPVPPLRHRNDEPDRPHARPEPARNPTPARQTDSEPPAVPPDDGLRPVAQAALRLVLEVLDGRRPAAQLSAYLAPTAVRQARAARVARRRGSGPSRLSSLRICRPTSEVAEVAGVYRLDGRARAVAARFERGRDASRSWRCVALCLG